MPGGHRRSRRSDRRAPSAAASPAGANEPRRPAKHRTIPANARAIATASPRCSSVCFAAVVLALRGQRVPVVRAVITDGNVLGAVSVRPPAPGQAWSWRSGRKVSIEAGPVLLFCAALYLTADSARSKLASCVFLES
jgi:hypothetical protein